MDNQMCSAAPLKPSVNEKKTTVLKIRIMRELQRNEGVCFGTFKSDLSK